MFRISIDEINKRSLLNSMENGPLMSEVSKRFNSKGNVGNHRASIICLTTPTVINIYVSTRSLNM